MNEAVFNLLMAVVTAAVTALSAYVAAFVKKGEQAAAQTDSIKRQDAIEEITDAISTAVSATSQTYVDALKAAGSFDAEAQKKALLMSLNTCIKALSPAAKTFIETAYGDLTEYLTGRIEAEVRAQKALPVAATAVLESTSSADTTTVAASTAAATAAAVVQNAVQKISSEAAPA